MAGHILANCAQNMRTATTAQKLFYVGAPVLMAFLLGWNGVGMLKPWPARPIALLYWLMAVCAIWWLTAAIFLIIRMRLTRPLSTGRFVMAAIMAAFVAQNVYRPINCYFALAYGEIFALDVSRVAHPWPTSIINFLEWQLAFLPFIILWVAGSWIGDRLSQNHFLSGTTRVDDRLSPADAAADKVKTLQSFLADLPRQALISMSAEDHYVRVHYQGGETRFFIRFSAALETLGAFDGRRIHRSHWAAVDHMMELEMQTGKSVVRLSDGRKLPVSASYRHDVVGALLHKAHISK